MWMYYFFLCPCVTEGNQGIAIAARLLYLLTDGSEQQTPVYGDCGYCRTVQ